MATANKTFVFRIGLALALFLLPALLAVSAVPAAAQESGSYGYVRVLEGSATLMQADSGDRDPAEVNQPLLVGDRLWVPDRSRAELVLPDGNLVRLDGGSELLLERLAASPDRSDRATVLRLFEGNLQLVVFQDSLGEELPRIETPSATIYVQHHGLYRVTADRGGWSEVVVRRGKAEVVTDRGSAEVRADERAVIDSEWASAEVGPAGSFDALERWARRLDEDLDADVRYVDADLRYRAAPLTRHGSWIYYNDQHYWRPRVDFAWRPYWHGRWIYTPAGLTWIPNEPWGWVPYHYGTWDFLPGHGWAWLPGRVWSPAWVYWYWGPSYAAWCPVGYYTRYYGPRFGWGYGFRSGVYGWAGGGWNHWDRWNFLRTDHLGRRDQHRYAVPIDELRGRLAEVPRGVVTTDTRGLTPDTWRDPSRVLRVLRENPNRPNPGRELPDVTPFIARRPELPADVARTVVEEKPGPRLDGTPLRPATLGRGDRGGVREAPGTRGTEQTLPIEKPRPRIRITNEPQAPAAEGRDAGGGDTDKPVRPPRIQSRRPAPGEDGGAPRPDRPQGEKPLRPSRTDDEKPVRVAPPPSPEPQGGAADRPTERPRARPRPPADDGDGRSLRRMDGNADRSSGYEKPRTGSIDRERSRPHVEPPEWQDRSVRRERHERPQWSAPAERPRAPQGYDRPETPRSYPRPQAPRTYSRPETPRSRPEAPRTYDRPEGPRTYSRPEPPRGSYERPHSAPPPRSVDRPQRSGGDGPGSARQRRERPPRDQR